MLHKEPPPKYTTRDLSQNFPTQNNSHVFILRCWGLTIWAGLCCVILLVSSGTTPVSAVSLSSRSVRFVSESHLAVSMMTVTLRCVSHHSLGCREHIPMGLGRVPSESRNILSLRLRCRTALLPSCSVGRRELYGWPGFKRLQIQSQPLSRGAAELYHGEHGYREGKDCGYFYDPVLQCF